MLWTQAFSISKFCYHVLSYCLFLNAATRSLMEPAALELCIRAAGEAGRDLVRTQDWPAWPETHFFSFHPLKTWRCLGLLCLPLVYGCELSSCPEMQDFFSAQQSRNKRCQENSSGLKISGEYSTVTLLNAWLCLCYTALLLWNFS